MDDTLTALYPHRFLPIGENRDVLALDQYTINKLKLDPLLLMENAGKAVADHCIKTFKGMPKNISVALFFVGSGNNGADALVAARHLLAKKIQIYIVSLGDKNNFTKERIKQEKILNNIISHSLYKNYFKKVDILDIYNLKFNKTNLIIVDGIFGLGLNRAPEGSFIDTINYINNLRKNKNNCHVISIDIPSGLALSSQNNWSPKVKADSSVVFSQLSFAHVFHENRSVVGRIVIKNIGHFSNNNPNIFYIKNSGVLKQLLIRPKLDAHKGDFGHVMVYEGDAQYRGASRLAALGALKTGAGLVSLFCQEPSCHADRAEFMHIGPDDLFQSRPVDTLIIGPGLGKKKAGLKQAKDFLINLLPSIKTLIIDADALVFMLDKDLDFGQCAVICTPHPKEAERLIKLDCKKIARDPLEALRKLDEISASKAKSVLWLLKGAQSMISAHNLRFIFEGELPILAVGGSGDLLTGMIAGLIGQSKSPLHASLIAVSLQMAVAKKVSRSCGRGLCPSDLANYFPRFLKL
jgi:hydroxyethylthiazole kinase-like uncharacterized protein yjeF